MIRSGIDIVHNERIEPLLSDASFLNKVFQNSELKHREKLKGIFALKEAVMKALGRKIEWKLIEISFFKGKPKITLSQEIQKGIKEIEGSISHDGEYTIALVVMQSA